MNKMKVTMRSFSSLQSLTSISANFFASKKSKLSPGDVLIFNLILHLSYLTLGIELWSAILCL
uniref:Uncharacterized protein n=1 Tax=Brassica oleracea TaxID=3712 RepID=A0A3P6CFX2_BRAOL|nr:unnamed protein product [Brassica oleracea]